MSESVERIAILVFDGIERLDFEGPLGVFGWARRATGTALDIRLVSKDGKPIRDHLLRKATAVDGPSGDETAPDLLIVPGGNVDDFIGDAALVNEVKRLGSAARIVASVCTGAFLVAKAGLATGKTMVTHRAFRNRFRAEFPTVTLLDDRRYNRDGALWSSAGISAGIDLSLKMVGELWSVTAAKQVREYLEYYPEPPFSE